LAGAMADHRYAMPVAEIERWLAELATNPGGDRNRQAIWNDLRKNAGLILAGESLSPWAHALVHKLNRSLNAPVSLIEPVEPAHETRAASITGLAEAMRKGEVALLVILGGNPAYDAPAGARFSEALGRVPFSVHLSLYDDETSHRCTWHLPSTHFLEHWSDARAYDGSACIVQPLIAPLYGGTSPHELLAALAGQPRRGYEIVKETWKAIDWEDALRSGLVANTAFAAMTPSLKDVPPARQAQPPASWTLRFVPDESVLDGSFANNAWLQELPRSHSKLTWDNAALIAPASAMELGITDGEVLKIASGGQEVAAPACVVPGHPERSLTLSLGYGRSRAGSVGNGVGCDANRLRNASNPWSLEGVAVSKSGRRHALARTQHHDRMEGRDLARSVVLAGLSPEARAFPEERHASLYPAWPYESYRWTMSVSLNACVGCNACTIACQAENNIPTVGKEEVMRGRHMHWIRVDRYHEERERSSRTVFQPVPCMHCENAPCEYVCPVGAPVHDSEGLNLQVYNRCVGTRFCSQNCPYKVRRFNFLKYSPDDETLKAQRNPEVTVRMRGVMEKCTFCVQRITRARIEAEKEGRRIRDGEVVTACQAACPAGAIVFGDLADPESAVSRAKRSPLDYALLAELNTRPRTTYEARVLNPNPEIADG
ncbi:MAG: 4Fe-4S dicluster domain-containing protein, partial [Betaproteobacteria bacterium]|nr:4Fe-4S dicluster domain-containing protein [Betaproteobacteria bacterium]